ncbi:MAG: hypothetical protein JRG97_08925 [Deltaproteobacteria bacterium]|nr:hypothetical protein [Deltaproteobacteria bacterium]MBW2050925.1 hypothetical protein [Deltaproteobacteria bacterium]MBW2141180.1 hypothetical protein [Deltaproteobacteria bacterium]MBW2323704.1 hypothetical protein [Deltaproteobacteria bacterium]
MRPKIQTSASKLVMGKSKSMNKQEIINILRLSPFYSTLSLREKHSVLDVVEKEHQSKEFLSETRLSFIDHQKKPAKKPVLPKKRGGKR